MGASSPWALLARPGLWWVNRFSHAKRLPRGQAARGRGLVSLSPDTTRAFPVLPRGAYLWEGGLLPEKSPGMQGMHPHVQLAPVGEGLGSPGGGGIFPAISGLWGHQGTHTRHHLWHRGQASAPGSVPRFLCRACLAPLGRVVLDFSLSRSTSTRGLGPGPELGTEG